MLSVQWRHVRLVFTRELLDYRRQRRVWRRLFLQPFIVILLLAIPVLLFRAAEERERGQEYAVAVVGDLDAVPGLRGALEPPSFELRAVHDGERAVSSRAADTAVVIPPGAASMLASGSPVEVLVLSLPVRNSSRFAGDAVIQRLTDLRTRAAATAIERAGLDGEIAAPFALTPVDLGTVTGEGTRFGLAQALPALLVIQLFGLMAAAEERIAGAKDRRVLEPLLVLPFRRLDILLGIGGATMSAGVFAAALLFVPLVIGLALALAAVTGAVAGPFEVAAAMLLGVAMFGVVFTAIGLYAGARAHSGSEGSVFVTVAQLTVFALVAATPFLVDVAATGPLVLTPVLGPILLVRDGVSGGFEAGPTLTALVGTGVVTTLLVRRAVRLIEAEGSILRTAGS